MRVFVTGGCGFIGQNVVSRLLKEGHEVTVTASGSEPIVPGVKKVVYTTLTGIDWDQLRGQDIVFHFMANNDTLCNDHTEMIKANFVDSVELLRRADKAGCKKFIYASSTAVYGAQKAPYVEGKTPEEPLNVYGESKRKFDFYVSEFGDDLFKIPTIGFRYCNVYGPGEERKGQRMSMIGQLMRSMMAGEQPRLFKHGEQKRDWVYIDDVVDAAMLAMQSDCSGIYNIGSGQSWTFNDVALALFRTKGLVNHYSELDIQYIDCPFADKYQNHTECNIEKARRELGYSPSFDLRSGIRAYLNYLSSSETAAK
jgi:ADP-L-glycero-D-manno-heptose 6-epimerase